MKHYWKKKYEGIDEVGNMQTGEKERQRDTDVKIESRPENGEVQPGQRWRDSSANKIQSMKERDFLWSSERLSIQRSPHSN